MATPAFEPQPIQRATAAEQIAQQIRDAIRTGRLGAGHKLPSEPELAAEYGVSRPTVREALRILAAGRLVESTRGAAGGTFVALPAAADVAASLGETIELWFQAGATTAADVEQARAWIERGCVRLAAECRTDADLEAITAAVDRARDASIDMDAFLALDLEFHVAISRAAHNSVLDLAMRAIHLARPRTNSLLVDVLDREPIIAQHAAIAHAIRDRDPDAAERAFAAHLEHLAAVRARALADRDPGQIPVVSLHEAHPADA